MKVLNQTQVAAVSGGQYDLIITLHVPTPLDAAMTQFVDSVVLGQVSTTQDIINGLNLLGPAGNAIVLTNFEYANFS